MHDLIFESFMSAAARLADVLLRGAAIAGAASLVLAFGENLGASYGSLPPGVETGRPRRSRLPGSWPWPAMPAVLACHGESCCR